jgi:hypothetical protein
MGRPPVPIADRFWNRVEKTDSCWEWTGARALGYGVIKSRGKMYKAHRISWEAAFGAIPPGMLVCHRCDNPACVRPEHLFLGTDLDNARDKVAKGRQARQRGEAHPGRKLAQEQATEIRCLAAWGNGHADIAAAFNISRSQVGRIVAGQRWAA